MNSNYNNLSLLVATTLLIAKLKDTDIIISNIGFEDGSGGCFYGELWSNSRLEKSKFFLRIEKGKIETFIPQVTMRNCKEVA